VDEYVKQVMANSLRTEGRTFTIKGTVGSAFFSLGGIAVKVRGDDGSQTNFMLSLGGRGTALDYPGLDVGDVVTFTGVSRNEHWAVT